MTNVDRPIGPHVSPLPPKTVPDLRDLTGHWMRLEPLGVERHAKSLFASIDGKDPHGHIWTYLTSGPFTSQEEFTSFITERVPSRDPWFYSFVSTTSGDALGMGAFMRADPANGVIEIGHIWMSPALQRTRESTEAIFLMMRHAFDDLGSRRLEWKCNALNAPSRAAALRFGFTYEGTFRQHMINRGRNRDTAWYSVIDTEWPRIKACFEAWLAPSNFDSAGRQKAKLQVA